MRYLQASEKVSEEIRNAVASGKLSIEEGAAKAHELRIQIKTESRIQSSAIGRTIAEASGPIQPLEAYLEKYTQKKFPGKIFINLALEEKQVVYNEILNSSGRTRLSFNSAVPSLRIVGGSLLIISISISAYNIWCSQNRIKASLKEAIVFSGGAAGGIAADALASAALGAEAGKACGPFAPAFATGLFVVGGIIGAWVAGSASEHYDKKLDKLANWLE